MLPLDLETVLFTKPARHVLVQFPIGLWIGRHFDGLTRRDPVNAAYDSLPAWQFQEGQSLMGILRGHWAFAWAFSAIMRLAWCIPRPSGTGGDRALRQAPSRWLVEQFCPCDRWSICY
jgi:hypothetical protein